jgi:hypothetical protein
VEKGCPYELQRLTSVLKDLDPSTKVSKIVLMVIGCSFNQLDLPEYSLKEQLQDRLLLAIHEASEGFGFG